MSEITKEMTQRNTMYDNMKFPKREFREFPMAVPVVAGKIQPTPYDAKGKPHPIVIVNDQSELDALTGPEARTITTDQDGAVSRVEGEDDIRKALYIQCEQQGVQIDKRWSVQKIEQALMAKAAEKTQAAAAAGAAAGSEAV